MLFKPVVYRAQRQNCESNGVSVFHGESTTSNHRRHVHLLWLCVEPTCHHESEFYQWVKANRFNQENDKDRVSRQAKKKTKKTRKTKAATWDDKTQSGKIRGEKKEQSIWHHSGLQTSVGFILWGTRFGLNFPLRSIQQLFSAWIKVGINKQWMQNLTKETAKRKPRGRGKYSTSGWSEVFLKSFLHWEELLNLQSV